MSKGSLGVRQNWRPAWRPYFLGLTGTSPTLDKSRVLRMATPGLTK